MSIVSEVKSKSMRGRQAPSYSLEQAIQFLEQLHRAVGDNAAGRDTLARALGHAPNSGSANTKIGTLSHFGLVDAKRGGTYQLTSMALNIVLSTSDAERAAAVVDAAKSPSLYEELIRDFAGKQIPTLFSNFLVRSYGVLTKSADEVASNFRATMEFAGLLRNGVLHAEPATVDQTAKEEVEPATKPKISTPTTSAPTPVSSDLMKQSYTIPLDRTGTVAILSLPIPVEPSYWVKIKAWVDYAATAFADDNGDTPQR